jgi:NAD(P)-dependent dehydrogenase (short-subunit alcohol dehydrogenase family)
VRFQDKVAVVTGASMGIGKAAASAFAREGATVVIVDINRDQAEGAVKEIQAQSGDAHFIRADVSKEREVRTLIDEVMRRWKRLDVLVNNAGVYVQGDAAEVSLSDWERILAVNLTGPFLCTKHAVPAMIKNGGGVIINVASEAGLVGIRNQVAYNV